MTDKARSGDLLDAEIAHLRSELDTMAARARCRRACDRCAPISTHCRNARRTRRRRRGRPRMEALLLGIYAFFVWLIFIKLKWLPWNITSQVIVASSRSSR
jgi:hypothetical protein